MKKNSCLGFFLVITFICQSQNENKYFRNLFNNIEPLNLPFSSTFSSYRGVSIKFDSFNPHFKNPAIKYDSTAKLDSFVMIGKMNIDSNLNLLLVKKYSSIYGVGCTIWLLDKDYSLVGGTVMAYTKLYPANFYITEDMMVYDFSFNVAYHLKKAKKSYIDTKTYIYYLPTLNLCTSCKEED
ncbi:MAG: hypothetical protein ACK5UE_09335 [Chitinophagales bacterium]|jgi:hypothetical protein